MQKTAKKFLSMLLALMMVLSILPTAVFATEQATVAAPLDSIVPYGANDQTTGTATISVQNPVTFTGYSAFENVPYYLVTVPAGTTYVKATYKDAAILTNATSGEASGYYADVPQWTGGGVEMAYTESNGDITITIPLNYSRTAEDGTTVQKSFVLGADGSGTAYAPEYDGSASYAPVHFLAFTYEGNSAPTVASDAITTANVTLGNAWTLDLADVFTDAEGDTLTYTATINGVAQALNGTILGYTPTAAGTYTVVLTASDNTGTATHTITLTVTDANQQIPRLKEGVSSTASDTVTAGYAYNLTDLQAGNIFENPDGTALDYTNYYYYRSVGDTRTGPYYFTPALFGGITGYATGTITGCYNGGAITGNGYVAGIVGQTTKGVTACYNTGSITGAGNYVAGIVAFASGASASVKNCYNRAYVESTGSNVGAVVGMTNNASAAMSNLYYLDFTCAQGIGSAKSTSQTATAKTRAEMDSADFVTTMNTGMAGTFGSSRYSPALSWQTGLIGLTTPTKGNVNLDPFGYVDEDDLTLLQEWVNEGKDINQLTLEQRAQADMDGSGDLDEEDVNALIQYLEDPRENPL